MLRSSLPVIILLVATAICDSCSQSQTGLHYELDTNWPAKNSLGQPAGLGTDSKGNLVVFHRAGADKKREPLTLIAENTIAVLDAKSGKVLKEFGSDMFILPHGLTVDDKDNIWVTDTGSEQVFKFSSDGKLLMTLGVAREKGDDERHFNAPTDVAVLVDGSFYVSDGYGNSRVIKFSKEGDFVFQWGEKGSGEGQFNLPHALDLDEAGNVYVADRENGRVQKFDASGEFLNAWSTPSGAEVYAISINPINQAVFAVDYLVMEDEILGAEIDQLSSELILKSQFGRSGSYEGPVCRYHDIAIDADQNIYVADLLNNSLQKFILKSKLAK